MDAATALHIAEEAIAAMEVADKIPTSANGRDGMWEARLLLSRLINGTVKGKRISEMIDKTLGELNEG
jgi:hypothetical protein